MKILACALLGLGACTSYSSRMDARPLSPGSSETGLAADLLILERGRRYAALPIVPEYSYRRGMGQSWDLGGKVNLTSGEVSARFALASVGPVDLAWTAGLGLGYEPVTNNSTDLIFARAITRLIAQHELQEGGPSLVVTAVPSLSFTGPATILGGIAGNARWIVRPGIALGTKFPLANDRAFWIEAVAQPAYVLGGEWLRPAYQTGVGVTF